MTFSFFLLFEENHLCSTTLSKARLQESLLFPQELKSVNFIFHKRRMIIQSIDIIIRCKVSRREDDDDDDDDQSVYLDV